MRALISAAMTPGALDAIEDRPSWQVDQVSSVTSAVEALTSDERRDIAALIVEAEPVTDDLIASLPALEVIACLRSAPVNVDVDAATAAGIPVVFSPGRNAESVADFTLALLLAVLRGVARSHHGIVSNALTVGDDAPTRRGDDVIWASPELSANPYEQYKGPELSSLVVAVIGYGYMGAAVAARLTGLVGRVVVVDPNALPERVDAAGFELLDLATALPIADVVSLHARSTRPIIGKEAFAAMKTGSYLINTARATLLDYDALAEALRAGKLAGAGLDVFPEEPLRASSPLLSVPNLTMTPHLAGASWQVVQRQSTNLALNLAALYDPTTDATAIPVVNPTTLEAWRKRMTTTSSSPVTGPAR